MDKSILDALNEIPTIDSATIVEEQVTRLGGLTNLVYRVEAKGGPYLLRLAGPGTEEYIDRTVEAHNSRIAAQAGVSPEVLYFNETNGLMVTRYIEDCVTMTPDQFKQRKGSPARAAHALRKLHQSGLKFQFRFELFSMIDEYLATLDAKGATLPQGYHDVVKEAEAVRKALNVHHVELAPCHCDPLSENFLDDGERMWIVDWEYSGMNDPIWDLGDVSVEADFNEAQDREMMNAYCDGDVPAATYGRMVIYKAMCDLLWTLWGLIQHANNNPADDFWAYSVNRFERCKTLMGSADFGAHLAAIHNNKG